MAKSFQIVFLEDRKALDRMKKNTAVIRAQAIRDDLAGSSVDASVARRAVHPSLGRSGEETGMRTGMVEAVDGVSVCFTCQQVGHITRFCPMRMGQAVSDGTELDKTRQDDKKRREGDRNEFLSALSQAGVAIDANASSRGTLVGLDSKPARLPTFIAVKKRRGQQDFPPDDAAANAGGLFAAVSIAVPVGVVPPCTVEPEVVPSTICEPVGGLGGLGEYASSSEEDQEDRDNHEDQEDQEEEEE